MMFTLKFSIIILTASVLSQALERKVEVTQSSYESSHNWGQGKDLYIEILPLGDGDSTIINCPNGDVIVVDMGKPGRLGWTESMVTVSEVY